VACAITEDMEPCHHQNLKRHAQLRHQPRSDLLWVGDPEHWALVRRKPRPPLVCPEAGCGVELISYENLKNKYNPRIFKFKSVNRSCDHWSAHGQGGGPESAQHEWLKLRLTRIAQKLGYKATPEHAPTHADVFVHEASFCLEVQLNPTQFRRRTKVREATGAKVCWLIREGLDSEKARKALFGLPAVRFRVIDRDDLGRPVAPWDHPTDHGLAHRARLQVFGTIARAPRADKRPTPATPGAPWFRTGSMDGFKFLEEILSGRRRWYRPNVLGHKSGLWALKTDVTEYFAFRDEARELAKRAPPPPLDVALSASPPGPADDPPTLDSSAQVNPSGTDVAKFAVEEPPTEVPPALGHVQPSQPPAPAGPTAATAIAESRGWWRRLWRRW
jgi:hypothetical protein